MADDIDTGGLRQVLRALRSAGILPQAASVLTDDAESAVVRLADTVLAEVPAFTDSANPDVIPELRQHLAGHVDEVCQLLGGGSPGNLAFVIAHAERRAAQKFPLDAVLHAYRCLHRALAGWIRDAALVVADEDAHMTRVVAAVAEFTIEYTGAVGTLMTSAYVSHTRLLAEAEGDRRTELLNTLLDGYDESDRHAAQLLRRAGYLQQRQAFCVAIAQSVDPAEMQNPARAKRMADAIASELARTPLRTIAGVRDNQVVVIISGVRRLSGWTAPQSLLADRVYPLLRLLGPAALVGLSNDAPSTSHIPRAAAEARLALDYADVANRVMLFSHIPFRQMLISRARADIQSALPAWMEKFIALDRRARGTLSETLRSYANCNMNVLKTAKAMSIHPNTIYARMQRITDATGMNALEYHALTELLLAIDSSDQESGQLDSQVRE